MLLEFVPPLQMMGVIQVAPLGLLWLYLGPQVKGFPFLHAEPQPVQNLH